MSGTADLLLLVNTDINEPLNYLMWLNNIELFGENSYVAKQEDKIVELTKSANAKYSPGYLGLLCTLTSNVGKYIADVFNFDHAIFDPLNTFSDIANSSGAMTIALADNNFYNLFINNEYVFTNIASSAVAMEILKDNAEFVTDVTTDNDLITISTSTPSILTELFKYVAFKSAIWNSHSFIDALANNSYDWLLTSPYTAEKGTGWPAANAWYSVQSGNTLLIAKRGYNGLDSIKSQTKIYGDDSPVISTTYVQRIATMQDLQGSSSSGGENRGFLFKYIRMDI